jgi:peptidoglycan/xylan/chitin deacetylase (PgdA/CDA1 family)
MQKKWLALMMLIAALAVVRGAVAQTGNSSTAEAVPAASATTLTAAFPEFIPVVCYHRFGHYGAKDPYFVTPEELKQQFEIIKSEGFTPITTAALKAGLDGTKPFPEKPLLITIDDGYADFVNIAQPIFKEYGYTATLFVYIHFIDSKMGLSHGQLQQLEKDGFEIGSHSWTHPKLTKPTPAEAAKGMAAFYQAELNAPYQKLKEWLGHDIIALAYPYGLWDTDSAKAAQEAGYQLMFTVDQGTNNAATPREQLKRIMIVHKTSDKMFRYLINDRPLKLASRTLEPGQHITGPVESVTLTIDPEQSRELDPKSWVILKGGIKCKSAYDAAQQKIIATFAQPWTHGTDAVMVVARDKAQQKHYKETWLVHVAPPVPEGGK